MSNPYLAPGAELSEVAAGDTYTPQVFAWQGRIGRLRYLAYGMGVGLLTVLAAGLVGGVGALAGLNPDAGAGLVLMVVLLYIPATVMTFVLAKRRLNDLGRSGWLAPLMLVPFVNFFFTLYLVFWRGSEGANAYGPAPGPNTLWVKIGGLAVPVVVLTGVLAAVAIPAYKTYTDRARAASSGTL